MAGQIEKWHISHYMVTLEFKRGYWRWAVCQMGTGREYTGKDKDKAYALGEAMTELSARLIRDGITQPQYDIDPIYWD